MVRVARDVFQFRGVIFSIRLMSLVLKATNKSIYVFF